MLAMKAESRGDREASLGHLRVRMANTIGVNDGGGRILNSSGQRNEPEAFRKPARWVDYSGPITREQTAGITLMDHPKNPGHPTPFHLRDNGRMGVSPTLHHSIIITRDRPLRLRYALWIHPDVPDTGKIDVQWQQFAHEKLHDLKAKRQEKTGVQEKTPEK